MKQKSAVGVDGAPSCRDFRCFPPEAIYGFIIYYWRGEFVYYVQRGCCDFENPVLTLHCVYICAPDGGIGGDGDGECPDFAQEAVEIRSCDL